MDCCPGPGFSPSGDVDRQAYRESPWWIEVVVEHPGVEFTVWCRVSVRCHLFGAQRAFAQQGRVQRVIVPVNGLGASCRRLDRDLSRTPVWRGP
jgi:hypothetical protein